MSIKELSLRRWLLLPTMVSSGLGLLLICAGFFYSDVHTFRKRKVDDLRVLASVLEANGMEVIFAENGRDGVATLQANPDVDLILMDVMMPEMDGYETMAAVREIPQFKQLPIISLTAKAMKGDREKTIAAGASDYITKPVDTDQLLSLMRVWLYR